MAVISVHGAGEEHEAGGRTAESRRGPTCKVLGMREVHINEKWPWRQLASGSQVSWYIRGEQRKPM